MLNITKKQFLFSVLFALFISALGVVVNGVLKLDNTGGAIVPKVEFEDMDSTETHVQEVNLSMIDETPVITSIVSIDTSTYSAFANNWSFSSNFLFYHTWYDGSGTDSLGPVFLQVQCPPGNRWETIDTLKTNDTSGYQGIVELRKKGPAYRVVTTVTDLTVSMYNGRFAVWFYKPGMDLGFAMTSSKF